MNTMNPAPPKTPTLKDHIFVLHQIGQILGTTTDLEDALNQILEQACVRLSMSIATVSLLQEETGQVSIDVAYGLSQDEIERGRYNIGEGITGKVVESGKSVIVPRINSEPLFLNRTGAHGNDKEPTSFVCVPISLSQRVVGTLSADAPYLGDAPLQDTVRLLTIAAVMIAQSVAAHQRARSEQKQLVDENKRLKSELRQRFQPHNLIGNSRAMQEVCELIQQVAPSDATVMLRGESGTGKELVADAIHYNSLRASQNLVKVHVIPCVISSINV